MYGPQSIAYTWTGTNPALYFWPWRCLFWLLLKWKIYPEPSREKQYLKVSCHMLSVKVMVLWVFHRTLCLPLDTWNYFEIINWRIYWNQRSLTHFICKMELNIVLWEFIGSRKFHKEMSAEYLACHGVIENRSCYYYSKDAGLRK